jgi:uncharacterized protein (TIGR04222 family)
MNPFDWTGPSFLLFFLVAFGAVVGLNFAVKELAVGRRRKPDSTPVLGLDHYEAAYLSGAARAAVDAAVAVLIHEGRIEYDRGLLVPTAATARSVRVAPAAYREVALPFRTHPLESAVWQAVVENGRVSLRRLRSAVSANSHELAEQLQRRGLTITPSLRALGYAFGVAPVYLLLVSGIIKTAIGLARDKPVGILIVLLTMALFFSAFMVRLRFPRRTSRGDHALAALRKSNAALRATAVSAPQQLHAHEAALGYALFGSAVLGSACAELSADIQRLGSGVDDELKAELAATKPSLFSGFFSTGGSSGGGSSCGGGGCGGGGCGGGCGGCGS